MTDNSPNAASTELEQLRDEFASSFSVWFEMCLDINNQIMVNDESLHPMTHLYYLLMIKKITSDIESARQVSLHPNPTPARIIIRTARESIIESMYISTLDPKIQKRAALWHLFKKPQVEGRRLRDDLLKLLSECGSNLSQSSKDQIEYQLQGLNEHFAHIEKYAPRYRPNPPISMSLVRKISCILDSYFIPIDSSQPGCDYILVEQLLSQWAESEIVHSGSMSHTLYHISETDNSLAAKIQRQLLSLVQIERLTALVNITYHRMYGLDQYPDIFSQERLTPLRALGRTAAEKLDNIDS